MTESVRECTTSPAAPGGRRSHLLMEASSARRQPRVSCMQRSQGACLGDEAAAVLVGGHQQDVAACEVAVQDVQAVQVAQGSRNFPRCLPVAGDAFSGPCNVGQHVQDSMSSFCRPLARLIA